ncbi:BatD family protein [Roseovarius autotrophicus]|uniref:BatD family protein n=1 Tax=Roseovarius autotrophicus TaxID=2824121 RepID=UPI0019E625E7|nr:BatD family protein [Roseovarius autotrophicus]MBE0452369.1 BatD family protein [Roseovarius sp.]
MRALILLLYLWPQAAWAQTREVHSGELSLTVTVEESAHLPHAGEMILVTIVGRYRRHITLEKLEQPALDGFGWTQLGPDSWHEERERGQPVKVFTRRMALFPEAAGELEIAPFAHRLTLTDEGDNWFEHRVYSEAVRVAVRPAPVRLSEWFPVRELRIRDEWSNAPDQLAPGEGVLRVIRLEALGALPGMIPPMPEMRSPSGGVFAHPVRHLVDLTSRGPVTVTFWRWTIRPGNGVSAIVEPVGFDYFDSEGRVARRVEIGAQRVAYGEVVPIRAQRVPHPSARLPGWGEALLALAVFGGGLIGALAGWQPGGWRFRLVDPLAREVRRAARTGDLRAMRRATVALLARDGDDDGRRAALAQLDRAIFGRAQVLPDLTNLSRGITSR